MSHTRAVAHNSLIQLAGRVAAILLALLTVKLLTNALGPGEYGDYGVVLSYLAILVPAADWGLSTICAREMARDERESEPTLGNTLAMRVLLGAVLVPVAIGLAFWRYHKPEDAHLRAGIAAAACVVPLQLVNLSLVPVFQVRQRMIYPVIGDVLGRLLQLAVLLALFRAAMLGFMTALITAWLGMGVTLLVSLVAAQRLIRLRLEFELPRWRQLFLAAVPLGVGGIFSSLYFRYDMLLLREWRPPGEVGLYRAVGGVYEYSLQIPSVFITAAFPVLVGQAAQSSDRARAGIQRSFDFLLMAAAPLAVGVAVLAPQVIRFLNSPAFVPAAEPLQLLMAASVFSYLNSLFFFLLVAIDRQRDALVVNALILATNICLNQVMIPRWGMLGAAWAMLATEGLSFVCYSIVIRGRYGFYPGLGRVPRIALAAGLMGVALGWLDKQGVGLVTLGVIGLALYGTLALVLRIVDRETLQEVLRLRGRDKQGVK